MKVVPTLVADALSIKHSREDFLNLSGIPVVSLDRGNTCWDSCGAESGKLIFKGQSRNNQCETKRARSARVFLVYIKHSRPAQALRVGAALHGGFCSLFPAFCRPRKTTRNQTPILGFFVDKRAPKRCRNRQQIDPGGSLLSYSSKNRPRLPEVLPETQKTSLS